MEWQMVPPDGTYMPKEPCFARGRGSDVGCGKDRPRSVGETQVEPGEPPLPTSCR